MAEFTAAVYQNEFLPDGGTDVNAIVTIACSGAGTAGQTGGGSAGEIIIVDTSGSMGPLTMAAAKEAAQAALAEIVEHGVTGFLADDEAEFADHLPRAGELDPAACRRAAERRFSAAAMAAGYRRLYQQVLARAG